MGGSETNTAVLHTSEQLLPGRVCFRGWHRLIFPSRVRRCARHQLRLPPHTHRTHTHTHNGGGGCFTYPLCVLRFSWPHLFCTRCNVRSTRSGHRLAEDEPCPSLLSKKALTYVGNEDPLKCTTTTAQRPFFSFCFYFWFVALLTTSASMAPHDSLYHVPR